MVYTWNYQGDNDSGKLSYGTVSANIYTFNNSGGWALIGGSRQTGTLYLMLLSAKSECTSATLGKSHGMRISVAMEILRSEPYADLIRGGFF